MAGRGRRVVITIPPGSFESLVSGFGSAGAQMLVSTANRVAAFARINSAHNGSIPFGIQVGPVVGKTIKVVSTNRHTILVHNGSRPHIIRPRRRDGVLRFVVDGRVVYTRLVHHPGYKGNPFLTDALRQAR